jgi:hypothetical protein
MKKIAIVFGLLLFTNSWIFAAHCIQSYNFSGNLKYSSEKLLQQASELEQGISSYLTSPDWNEQKILKNAKEFRENCEQLYSLSANYYGNENTIYSLLEKLSDQIEEIIDRMKRHSDLKMIVREAFNCYELIIEYKKAILTELITELKEQSGDFALQIENWIDKEQKSQQKLLEKIRKFDEACKNIQQEVNAYFFDLMKVNDKAYQAYNLSLNINGDLKNQKLTEPLKQKWDVCFKLTENFKNTISQLKSKPLREEQITEEENYPPVGYFDVATREEISGWAFDPDAGANPIEVHIYINERHVATVTANEKRDDLMGKVPGLKEPYHGFRWKPENLPAGKLLVKVYAINVPKGDNPLLGRKIIF